MGIYKEKYVFNFFKTNLEEMRRKTQNLSKDIVKMLAESDFREMNLVMQECRHMRYSAQGYLEESKTAAEEKQTLVNVGYTMAVFDILQMYLEKLTIQKEIQQINTKYKNTILSVLARRGTLLHKDLANALGVSTSGLTAIIKQMNATDVKMINVEEISKFKLYSITPAAYGYVVQNAPDIAADIKAKTELEQKEERLTYTKEMNDIIRKRKGEGMMDTSINYLNKLIETCGESWKQNLDFYLKDENADLDDNSRKCIEDFLLSCREEIIEGKSATLQEVEKIINNDLLYENMRSYLDELLQPFYCVAPLRALEVKDSDKTQKMLKRVFEQTVLRFNPDIMQDYEKYGFDNEQIFSDFVSVLGGLSTFAVGKNLYYDAIETFIYRQTRLSKSLCRKITDLIDEHFDELKMNYIIDKLNQMNEI